MKALLALLVFASAGAHALELNLPPKPTAQEQTFARAFTNAIQTSNVMALVALQHCEPAHRGVFRDFFQDMLSKPCTKVKIERTDSSTATEHVVGKTRVRESLPVRWLITVYHPPQVRGGSYTTELRAGVEGDGILITTKNEVKP